jgi:formate hydrogenlyase subunit 6/NADH:ubiquinone oxidoreductase subunit I
MAFSIMEDCIGCGACARGCPVEAIAGEKGKVHAIRPERCIECGACGRVCPKAAVRDDHHRTVARIPKAEWPKPVFDLSRCISCAACESQCPTSAIAMSAGKPGGLEAWPRLAEAGRCVSCGYCAFYCPMSCIRLEGPARLSAGRPAATVAAAAAEKGA